MILNNLIKLITPTKALEAEAIAFRQEFFDNNEPVINGSSLFDKVVLYDDWLLQLKNNSYLETVSPDWVVTSVFFAIRLSDHKIVGIIDVRHTLNQFLSDYGGHIGYSVRPSERGKGYATEMLKFALDYCREIGLEKVMLGCYKTNTASIGIIHKCGGIWERETRYLDGKMMDIFWIRL